MDPKSTYFGTYDESKARIKLEIKLPQVVSRGRKRIEKIIKNAKSSSSSLMLTKGKGDDVEDKDEEDEAKETKFENEDPPKKKGNNIITKPTNSSPTLFTRRETKSKKNLKLGEDEEE